MLTARPPQVGANVDGCASICDGVNVCQRASASVYSGCSRSSFSDIGVAVFIQSTSPYQDGSTSLLSPVVTVTLFNAATGAALGSSSRSAVEAAFTVNATGRSAAVRVDGTKRTERCN